MEETKEQHSLHGFLQVLIYFNIIFEFCLFVYFNAPFWGGFKLALIKIHHIPIYNSVLISKCCTLILICLVSVGTVASKKLNLDPKTKIVYPLTAGFCLFFGSLFFQGKPSEFIFKYTTLNNAIYMSMSFIGAVLIATSLDNISKLLKTGLGKDKWNTDAESFAQPTIAITAPETVVIPMQFYYQKKVQNGFVNIANPYRGTMVIGTPGSGKTFSVICPFIRQLIAQEFTMCIYDFKFPDLGKIAYYHYLLAKQKGKMKDYQFHVVNLDDVSKSRRINPLKAEYITSLADASESAEALVEALKKSDKSGGADQFFTQSAVNFLSSCIYFLSKHNKGIYSSLPHILALLNRTYEEIFTTLYSEPELVSLLSPFYSAFKAKAFNQLEGQVGTLRIFISRLATKESFWVFSKSDFDLKISNTEKPGILILASDPTTQNINSACYSVVLNRLTRLINSKGNVPTSIIIDELPTCYFHKVENLIATARSNKVAVVLGLQEIPQFEQQYGKDTAATITSVIGNVISGSVRSKDTLSWLETLCGQSKQLTEGITIDRSKTSTTLNEKLDNLIPSGKISSLGAGEMVGLIAADTKEYTGQFETSAINCRITLPQNELDQEKGNYKPLPTFYDFGSEKEEILRENFDRINTEIAEMVKSFNPQIKPKPSPAV
ncbi:MAG: type IV secretory system conjugative DNA transfer family protein [Sphingobacteriaceae bacterium]|nr:MAG: type IV secretory system conjugative DNA transfer family protein [Sphingobacteriaceae bacterium]